VRILVLVALAALMGCGQNGNDKNLKPDPDSELKKLFADPGGPIPAGMPLPGLYERRILEEWSLARPSDRTKRNEKRCLTARELRVIYIPMFTGKRFPMSCPYVSTDVGPGYFKLHMRCAFDSEAKHVQDVWLDGSYGPTAIDVVSTIKMSETYANHTKRQTERWKRVGDC